MHAPWLFCCSAVLTAGPMNAAGPQLVRSTPAHHATHVATNLGVLRFHFDQNMKQNTWTFWQTDQGEFPPLAGANDNPWRDPRCAELTVAPLKPDTTYAVQLNSAARQGFRSAANDEPLPVTVVRFTTGSNAPPTALPPGRDPAAAVAASNRAEAPKAASGRPPCPAGWTDFANPLIGLQAHVPSNYWVRLHGGVLLTVEQVNQPTTMAFVLPFRPRPGAQATAIAEQFAKFVAQSEPQFQSETLGSPSPDRALAQFRSVAAGQPVEGKYCTLVTAGGTMAFVIGVRAPAGQLERELPLLRQIAQGFGFTPPRGRWLPYASPAGGFTMTLPEGWQVESGDGRSGKDNIDWVASDPRQPLSRAFQWCPRYCSPQLLQDPLHVMRGYQAAQFQNHEQALLASLSQISQQPRLLKVSVNAALTELFRRLNQQVAQLLAGLGVGQSDVTVYDCLAEARLEGQPVLVALVAGVQTLTISGGFTGPLTDLSLTLRGWCAPSEQFVRDSPVLEKVCASMELTPAFLRRITQGNAYAADKIRETYAHMNELDNQIRQSRWDTMDAIAEMNYDTLRDTGGYVNEQTGRIEQIPPDQVVKNRHGEYVSREEVERGVDPNQATVLRAAHANDYLRGAYGRIEF